MTGIGAYMYIVWGIWLRHCLNFRQDEYQLVWPGLTAVPVIVKQDKLHINGHANGYPNGAAKRSD
jgi:dihydroceramidase